MSTSPLRTQPRTTRHARHTPDTSAEFASLAVMPEGPEKERLQDGVVRAWLPMAHRLARRYRDRGETMEDLQQVAALALVKAVERFNPERGGAFEPFAIPTIYGELKRHFRDNLWDLHVPRRVQNLRNQVRVSIRELSLVTPGGSPTVAQIAEHSGLTEEDVQLGMEALHGFRSLSLDAPVAGGDGEDGFGLLDTLSSEEHGYDLAVDREAVRGCLARLPSREREILYLRFFCDMTQSSIARRFGISQMHVSRLLAGACRRVREEIDAGEAGPEPDGS
ncbi:SigB/SigF/SigG family RNA polymerase sigma factor [Streptomyces sp. HNM0574]|uniref:SigB/SigF/SigG family RNA polymerase sigma factor n=1 Tax=Streptomyces sp. HNM0574 TaxID=2714954 RepID=UPI00146AADAA|nr:SigB/SigF/SigG family RNA polymerase sigma factor [Streptomyces sp. HNM0574]NLU68684.1 SigB/SigF/SigG family RNA polymerase sigma factor [Streptomyces sp. HNM0574]